MLPLILQLVIVTYKITPSPEAFGGRLRDSVEQHSDSAKRWRGRGRQGSQSCSRRPQGYLDLGAAGERASEDARGPRGAETAGQRLASGPVPEHNPLLHRGSDRDRSVRRIHRCNQQEHPDQSGWFHMLYVQSTVLEAG